MRQAGLLALGGSWFTHWLTDRKERRTRAEEKAERLEERLRELYVRLEDEHSEFVVLAMRVMDGTAPKGSEGQLYDLSLNHPQTTLLTLQLLETSPEARKRLAKASTKWPPAVALLAAKNDLGDLIEIIDPWIQATSSFSDWLRSTRFPPKG